MKSVGGGPFEVSFKGTAYPVTPLPLAGGGGRRRHIVRTLHGEGRDGREAAAVGQANGLPGGSAADNHQHAAGFLRPGLKVKVAGAAVETAGAARVGQIDDSVATAFLPTFDGSRHAIAGDDVPIVVDGAEATHQRAAEARTSSRRELLCASIAGARRRWRRLGRLGQGGRSEIEGQGRSRRKAGHHVRKTHLISPML